MEEWKDIIGYEGRYRVSSFGKIYSSISNKLLNPTIDSDGYEVVGLFINGKQKKKKVHRIVAEAFIDNLKNYKQVNHKDENKVNNNVSNLEWCDCTYNINYGTRNEKVAKSIKNNTKKYRRKVVCLSKNRDLIKIYPSLRSVEENGYNHGIVYQLCSHKGRYKSHGNYLWEYYDEWING